MANDISAAMIKELRARTGAGMMDCKKALADCGGDLDAAVAELRKRGVASAQKKAGRIAAEGVIVLAENKQAAVLVEVNCETDFVGKDESFGAFARAVADVILAQRPKTVDDALKLKLPDGNTMEDARQALVGKIGENINVRRFCIIDAADGAVSAYMHGARIGVLVAVQGGDAQLHRDVAMHIAASAPLCISEDDMPKATLDAERAIFVAQAIESGKPKEIAEKMTVGRMKKFLKENTLLGQPFVKQPDSSIAQHLGDAKVLQMARFEVGEGLEKRADDFVAEVKAQAGAK